MRNNTYTVYSLSLDGKIIYVGKTQLPINRRLEQHKSKGGHLIKHLGKRIQDVLLRVIDTTNSHLEIRDLEVYWIHKYKSLGHPLINKQRATIRKGIPKKHIPP